MSPRVSYIIFISTWWILAAAALVAYLISGNLPSKRRAGLTADLMVIAPFILVPGLFYLGRYGGTYVGSEITRAAGAIVAISGLCVYLICHFYLRKNWSLAGSIREGQGLVVSGPYRFVRHPMYGSMTLVVLGSGMLTDNYLIIASTAVVAALYYVRATLEETLLRLEFPEFAGYARRVRMFIPFVF